MKKIAISLLIVLFAIFAFFYIQLNQLKNSIADHLAQYDIQVNDFSLNLLPQPTVNLSGLKYHQLSRFLLINHFMAQTRNINLRLAREILT